MDQVQEHKSGLATEPTKTGFSLQEFRGGLSSGLYFDENMEKGLRSGDASSILYYGLNCDGGGLDSSAFREGKDVFKDGNFSKIASEDGAVDDLFSAIGLSNASEDYFWGFDFTKKFSNMDYQFCDESDSWNSSLVSQSSGSSSKTAGISEQSSQIIECQNNQPERLITREVDGNYMTSFVWDMLMNREMGLNSSSSYDHIDDTKNIAIPVDTSESYHCSNVGYFATSHDHNHTRASCTSLSMQCYDASLVDEGMEAGDPSLQGGSLNMAAYSRVLQDFSEVIPVDTSESYNCSNAGHFGIPHDLNNPGARCNALSVQGSDAGLVDENSKAVDPSLLCTLINKPAYSCGLQDFSEVSELDTSECYNRSNVCGLQDFSEVSELDTSECYNRSNVGHFGTSHELNHPGARCVTLSVQCSDEDGLVVEKSKEDPSFLGVLINQPELSCDLQDFTEVSPMSASDSYPCSNDIEGYFGASHDLKHPRPLYASLSMQCCDASLMEDDAEVDDLSPSFQGVLIKKPASSCDPLDIGQVKNVTSPVETSESYHSNQGYFDTAFELNLLGPLGISLSMQCCDASPEDEDTKADHGTSLSTQCCDANPEDENTKADHSTCQGITVNKPAESCDRKDIGQVIIVAGPMETSCNRSNKGCCGSADDLKPLGPSFTSMYTEFSDASLVDEDKKQYDPSLQSFLISKPADSSDPEYICKPESVASPVDTGESDQHKDEGYVATSNDLDLNPPGLSHGSIFVQGTDASPMVEDTMAEDTEDDPTLQSFLINKRAAKCKKVGPNLRRKRMQKPILRCSSESPTFETRRLRRRKEESTNCSKRKHVEVKSQNKRHIKRIEDAALVAHNGVTRRSSKQDLDSDHEYDPTQSTLKIRRTNQGSDGKKNHKLWTLSEVIKLVDGISEFGVGKWTAIQRSSFGSAPCRTSLDIRDKWRNLIKTSGLRLKHIKKEESGPKNGSIQEESSSKNGSITLPKSLLERICELDRVHPYLRSGVKRLRNCSPDLPDSSSE